MKLRPEYLEPPKLKALGLIWIKSDYPALSLGLENMLQKVAHVYRGQNPPTGTSPSLIILCTEDVFWEARHLQALAPDIPRVLFGLHVDLQLAKSALKAGINGFITPTLQPEEIILVLRLASKGEVVIPKELINELVMKPEEKEIQVGFPPLTYRKLEVLELVAEGLSNAQIARRLCLSESTIKQHLYAIYKHLEVKNRFEAARLFRQHKSVRW